MSDGVKYGPEQQQEQAQMIEPAHDHPHPEPSPWYADPAIFVPIGIAAITFVVGPILVRPLRRWLMIKLGLIKPPNH